MPGQGTEQKPSFWMSWHMGIACAGLESQMRFRRCGWLQGRKEPRWTWKGSLREVLERRENFHLAFPASCHVPRAQPLGCSPSAWSLVFLHEFFISGKEPLSLTGAAMGACFPSSWRQSRWRTALRQNYLSLERGRALRAPGGTAPIPYYCRFPSFTRRLGYCFIEIILRVERSPLGSSVCGISQARTLEWVAISFSRGSFQPRDQTSVSCTGRRILYH